MIVIIIVIIVVIIIIVSNKESHVPRQDRGYPFGTCTSTYTDTLITQEDLFPCIFCIAGRFLL